MENLAIDNNMRNVLGAVTNDGNEDIKRVRVNPITGALIVEANVTSSNTSIGSTIPGGTAGSVLFLDVGGTLAEDNSYFYYDPVAHQLALGHNSPTATLDIVGSLKYSDGSEVNGYVLTTDGSGNATWAPLPSGNGYDLIQNQGMSVIQRNTINLTNLLTASDVGGKTQLDINVTNLGNDATLISTLESNIDLGNLQGLLNWNQIDQTTVSVDLATQVTGLLPASNIDITNLESTLNLANIAGQIDLTTQVTGQLPPANIDVVGLANDATFLTNLIPNLDENVKVAVDGVTITGDGTTGNPLVATGGTSATDKLVGTGSISNKSYFNIQLHYTEVDNAGAQVWTTANGGTTTPTMWYTTGSTGSQTRLTTLFEGFPSFLAGSGVQNRQFNRQKEFIIETIAYIDPTEATACFLGLNVLGNSTHPDVGTNTLCVGFGRDGSGNWYIRSATGSAHTDTAISAPSNTAHTYRIEYDPANTQARFYIDGSSVGTITTNLPSASTSVIGVFMGNDTGGANNSFEYASAPSFSLEV